MWTKSLLLAVASMTVSAAATTVSAQRSDGGYSNNQYNASANPQYAPNNSPAAATQLVPQQGRYFSVALPAGWKIDENANALNSCSPDGIGGIQHVGFANLPAGITPQQFVESELTRWGVENPQIIAGQRIDPGQASDAAVFEVTYAFQGIPCRGFVVCHVVNGYSSSNAAMTLGAAPVANWAEKREMLTQIAMSVKPGGGGGDTYTANASARQNNANAVALANQARANNAYAAEQWKQVAEQRQATQDRQSWEFRQALGGVTQYQNQYTGRPENLSSVNTVYWQNPYTGEIVGDTNPTYDPRTTQSPYWNRMQEQGYQR